MLFTALTIVGLLIYLFSRSKTKKEASGKGTKANWPIQINWIVLVAAFGLSLLLFLTYNLTFVQHQGRYLFPGLIPIGLAVALAWTALLQPLTNRWKMAVYLIPLGLGLALFGLDLLALFRFIVPEFGG